MRIITYLLAMALVTFFSISIVFAKDRPIIVAVIDTGYTAPKKDDAVRPRLCRMGHADFSNNNYKTDNMIPSDQYGHGTNIVHVIANQIGDQDGYCIVVIKYFHADMAANDSGKAMTHARRIRADVVNFSSSGRNFDSVEESAINSMLKSGVKIVVAAGNDNEDFDGYSARLSKDIVVVGNLNADKTRHHLSNYGKLVNRWEIGTDVCGGGSCLTGTSQATAVATGKIVKEMLNERNENAQRSTVRISESQNTRRRRP